MCRSYLHFNTKRYNSLRRPSSSLLDLPFSYGFLPFSVFKKSEEKEKTNNIHFKTKLKKEKVLKISFKQKWEEEKRKKKMYIYFFYILNNPHISKTKSIQMRFYPFFYAIQSEALVPHRFRIQVVTVIVTHNWTYIYMNIEKVDFWIKYIVHKPVLRHEEFNIFATRVIW